MASAVVGTAVGLYIVINQDTSHGAEHHPLGDPHGEGGAPKHGTDSTIGEENKSDEPAEESKEESKDEAKEEPVSEQQDPSKATKENSEEKDHQSPDQSDKVRVPACLQWSLDANVYSPIPARRRLRARTRHLASKRDCPTTTLSTPRRSRSTLRRARRARVLLRPLSYKEPSQLSGHLSVPHRRVS
jgi:hypothetical protein